MARRRLAKSVKQALGRIGKSSRFETNNRKVHRLAACTGSKNSRRNTILAACNSQKDNVILAIGAPGSLDYPSAFGDLPQTGAPSRFGIGTIEGSVAAPTVNETVACFHAKGAIAKLNEPTSEA